MVEHAVGVHRSSGMMSVKGDFEQAAKGSMRQPEIYNAISR
jgi:hypothetical protein